MRRRRAKTVVRVASQAGLLVLALVVDLLLWGLDSHLRFGLGQIPTIVVVATALPVFTALVWRRQRPRSVFVLAWVYCLGWAILLPAYQPFTALLVSLYTVARHLRFREGVGFLLGTGAVWAVATANTASIGGRTAASLGVTALIWCVMAGLVWVAGRYGYRADEDARVRETMHQTATVLALQDERLRLARELHDVVSHSVVAITLQAAGTRRAALGDMAQVGQALQLIETTGTQAMQELRRLLGLLNGSADSSHAPTLCDLDALLTTVRNCGIGASLHVSGEPRPLPPLTEETGFRVLQEGCTNVIKHAGRGAALAADVDWQPDWLRLAVRNTSSGNPAFLVQLPESGFGLNGLRDRVVSLGGTFSYGPDGDGGFLVSAQLPTATSPATQPAGRETDASRSAPQPQNQASHR